MTDEQGAERVAAMTILPRERLRITAVTMLPGPHPRLLVSADHWDILRERWLPAPAFEVEIPLTAVPSVLPDR